MEVDQEILVRLLEMMDLRFPILSLPLQKFAKSKIQSNCNDFKACRGRLQCFSKCHGISLLRCNQPNAF